MNILHKTIAEVFKNAGVTGNIEFSVPPNPAMGDLAFGCFALAKEQGKNPKEVADALAEKLGERALPFIAQVQTAGPYVNITLDEKSAAQLVMNAVVDSEYGNHNKGNGQKVLVEYACPNPLKAFHLGHLKNLITGEAIARTLSNAGYDVMRVNYQGDVGMHVAKALWGLFSWKEKFDAIKDAPLRERVEFLGQAYAHGAQHFENGEAEKQEVIAYNDKVYERSADIQEVYQAARTWSLEYFDTIYARLGTKFDAFFFESEMYERGVELVQEFLKKGVFTQADGPIIYEGSKHGLHDRVFINSKGFPTYEAKELALAEAHLSHNPDSIIHVVGKEQTEYFKVVIEALEEIFPGAKAKEQHVPGGFLQLKGGKMSSRLGNIVTGDSLLDSVQERIAEIMAESDVPNKEQVIERVTAASLKHAMLRADITKDVAFDLEASVNTSGDSGPYLLYIVARINTMLEKATEMGASVGGVVPETIEAGEKALLLKLAEYPAITFAAAQAIDPSKITRYLFELAQSFNSFYDACPVLKAEGNVLCFRLGLITAVKDVMTKGLHVIGIETVERM